MTARRNRCRTGSIAVLSLVLIVVMMAFVAFAVDVGYLLVTRTEMQRSADASAVAAAWTLISERGSSDNPKTRAVAAGYVALNKTGRSSLALAADDVAVGRLNNPSDLDDQLIFDDAWQYNAVEVRVQRTATQNGELPLFFARAIGNDTAAVQARATASFYDNIRGFHMPRGPGNNTLGILPFALDLATWIDLENGTIAEANLFPLGDGPPGNRGTVDIGSSNNSTADIARQIISGINAADMQYHPNGLEVPLDLNGDTGISAGVKDELASIIGQPRMIPVFDNVAGPGNNAMYHIVRWAGIKIVSVKLTGPMSKKKVAIQLADVITKGAIPADPGTEQVSTGIYSYPRLVR